MPPPNSLGAMAITQQEARQRILDELGKAVDGIAVAVSRLGDAYELLSVTSADRLEDELYRPLQKALGRGKRAYSGFAERTGFPPREFETPDPGRPSQGIKEFVEQAVGAVGLADRQISELQDSMLPIESGDADLRAGLTEVRDLLAGTPGAAREFLRTLGR